jgi:quinol monooxygenase YgiN
MNLRLFAAAILASLFATCAIADDHPVIADAKKAVKDPSKPFGMWVSVTAKKGQEKALETAFAECQKGTRKEKGCLAYDLLNDASTPGQYAFYEKWTGIDGLNAHLKAEHTEKLLKLFGDLLEPGTTIKFYQAIGD